LAISSAADGRGACAAIAGDPAGGRLASQYLARHLDGRGEVAIINQPIVTSTLDRVTVLRDDLSLQVAYQRGTSPMGEASDQGSTLFSKLTWVF
jgi:hypothetical protein